MHHVVRFGHLIFSKVGLLERAVTPPLSLSTSNDYKCNKMGKTRVCIMVKHKVKLNTKEKYIYKYNNNNEKHKNYRENDKEKDD
jgi:hypothetical protein